MTTNNGQAEINRLGIDLGGTKTEMVLLDGDNEILLRERHDTPAESYPDLLQLLADMVQLADDHSAHQVSIGIGTPGALSPLTGLLRNSNTKCLNGMPFKQDLEARVGRSVRIQNDANCFALSEARTGAGRISTGQSAHVVFGVIIGTGTGGGLVVNGDLLNGPHAITGEWGHNPLPRLSEREVSVDCYCGKKACIETFLSGPGMVKQFQRRFDRTLTSDQIVVLAGEGDRDCQTMMADYYDQMARALAMVINIVDPDAIVLGGGMSNIAAIYEEVPALLARYVFSDFCHTPVVQAQHGDSSGVFGAAYL